MYMHCMPQLNKELGWVMKSAIYVKTPVGWGSTYCFTAVGVVGFSVTGVTPVTKGPPVHIFLDGMFFVPEVIIF